MGDKHWNDQQRQLLTVGALAGMLLNVEQLAQIIHKSPASVRSDASRNPCALPPICRLPGNKRLLFRLEDVAAWLKKHVQSGPEDQIGNIAPLAIGVQKRGRGRPRKAAATDRAR